MSDNKNLWTDHNIELLLWSLVLFLVLAIADDATKRAFDQGGEGLRQTLNPPKATLAGVARPPEIGN